MNWRAIAAAGLLLAPALSFSGAPFTDIHPEEAYPDPQVPADFDPYAGLVSRVQEKLRNLGFDAGPINAEFGRKTQAALAQFPLAPGAPASGELDKPALDELGVEREPTAMPGT